MRDIIEIIKCDIEKCGNKENVKEIKTDVIFTTDQTEGRSVKPYLSRETFDICANCLDKVFKGNMIFAHGAQGNNIFYFGKE